MPRLSAGILLHRDAGPGIEVLIGHPGGPFWARKDDGAWSIPKGEYTSGEDPWAAAQREFAEELGMAVPAGPRLALGEARQPSGKILTVFAVHADLDLGGFRSNTATVEYPRGSGRVLEFPELDRVGWLATEQARAKLLAGQRTFLDRLLGGLGRSG